ncbi:BON domain-containing protein [Nocardia jejuensis]|uniref:BON domain-containing protein n=1 Tax=Nocardia jejuensis TaxID=328049 RepID=UPI001470EFEC|nr:BON domain-containing protein [Nocardia jejuensis]
MIAALRGAFARDERTAGSAIDVDIRGAVVVLEGWVSTDQQRRRAESIVHESLPALRVRNEIQVLPPAAHTVPAEVHATKIDPALISTAGAHRD